ncbi:MAG: Predicted L-rhamnose ABC transporter, transmembrane component 1 [uncultured Rubrobacteraceae bacterium]|uniref:Autoinducer 2 import system permease protein LsrD n=1 Tax=uncultured Rubrobacteraceae bacterium TaxID=349277 RepID=A0A6J4S1F6_9ACTN|nr:MAG: Predicted L-rhamnose ABC transporter, transmembrane component 1 [uncultured Rubrobacteraceae bacterium]
MSAATAVLRRIKFSREVVLLGVLIVLMVVMSLLSPLFFTVGNLLNTSRFFVEVGLMALGMTLIIITGGIDLSVGSNLALVSVAVGFSYAAGLPLPLAIVFGLVVGLAAGLFNGLFITLLDLHPLVVTLGTFALFQGLAYGLTNAQAVSDFPGWFAYFGQAYFGPVPLQLFIFILAVAVVWLILSRTSFGRYVYAIGNNEEAARFSGVPVRKVKLALYAGIGLLVAMASVIYTSRVYTARGDSGLGLELDVISAVVLGGASIYGGSGTIGGTVLGVLIIATLRNGLVLAGVPSTWQVFVLGILLLVAVFLNEFFRRREV